MIRADTPQTYVNNQRFIEFDGVCINTNEILYFNISEVILTNGTRIAIYYGVYEKLLNLLGCDNND